MMPTRNRLFIDSSQRQTDCLIGRRTNAESPYAAPDSSDGLVFVRRIGTAAPTDLRIVERGRARCNRIDPLRIEHDHSVSNTPFAVALLKPVGISYVHHPIRCRRVANALRPVKRPAIMLSKGDIAVHLDVLITGEVHRA